ncbi:MAG: DUF1289 domain-containing protein [Pseudomonadota bacterium]
MDQEAVCVGVCQIDPDTDRCIGCGRTSGEIFGTEEESSGTEDSEEKTP